MLKCTMLIKFIYLDIDENRDSLYLSLQDHKIK